MTVSLIKDPDMRLGGAEPIDIMDLTADTCRWPVRDAAAINGPWAFCGHGVARGRYCRKHAGMAYATSSKGKSKP